MPTAKDVIAYSLGMGERLIGVYFEDLTDEEIGMAPLSGLNCPAWQMGHIIAVEHGAIERLRPGLSPTLPPDLQEAHRRGAPANENYRPLLTKKGYLDLWAEQRKVTRSVLEQLTDEELAAETGVAIAPTVYSLMNLLGTHAILHAGQVVAARRNLGKPVVF